MHQHVYPFIRGETASLFNEVLKVDIRNLDRFQILNFPSNLNVFSCYVSYSYNTPNPVATEQLRVLLDVFRTDGHTR